MSTSLPAPLRSRDAGTGGAGDARGATGPPPNFWHIETLFKHRGRADYEHQLLLASHFFFTFRHPWALVKSYNNGARAMWLGIVHLTGMQPYTYILQTSTPRHSIEKGFAI